MRASELLRGLGTVSSLTAASRVLGLIRDSGMAALFGAGPLMDAFTVAFRLPNLARRLFGEGALTAAFLPVFVREHGRDVATGRALAWAVTLMLALVLLAVVVVTEALLALGFRYAEPEGQRLLSLCLVLTPYVLFICIAAQLSAVLHALRQFFWPSALPLVLNSCWIAGIVAAPRLTDDPFRQMLLISSVVLATGVLQVAALFVVLTRRGMGPTRAGDRDRVRSSRREIALAVVPTMIGLSITQLNTVADSLLAWGLSPSSGIGESWQLVEAGTATALYLGSRVQQVPLGVFGLALSTVLFPVLAEHARDGKRAELGADLTRGVQICLVIGVPAALGLILLASPIPRLLFEYGTFTARDSHLTSRMLAGYGLGVWAFMAQPIVSRGFYAVGDRMTPVRIGLVIVAVHLVLDVLGMWLFGGAGLAVATALAAIVHLAWLSVVLHRRVARLHVGALVRTTARVAAATLMMAAVCQLTQRAVGDDSRSLTVLAPLATSVATYAAAAYGLGLHRVVRQFRAIAEAPGETEPPNEARDPAIDDR